jgi:Glutamyl-tRNAGlu reductase, N-terminal domain
MSLFCFGLSHHTAPLDVRKRFTIPNVALPGALARLKIMPGINEGLILSTCNPTEFYVSGELRKWSSGVLYGGAFAAPRCGQGKRRSLEKRVRLDRLRQRHQGQRLFTHAKSQT